MRALRPILSRQTPQNNGMQHLLALTSRDDFRRWLADNAASACECWVAVKRGRPTEPDVFYYLDAVEEALCFGWIDSTVKTFEGVRYQRFSPRRPNSPWSELNKERVRRLEKLGLMTDAGRSVLPPMGDYMPDADVIGALVDANAYETFVSFPPLYQRIRTYNVAFYKNRDAVAYRRALRHLIDQTLAGKLYGEWNDYGRLLEY